MVASSYPGSVGYRTQRGRAGLDRGGRISVPIAVAVGVPGRQRHTVVDHAIAVVVQVVAELGSAGVAGRVGVVAVVADSAVALRRVAESVARIPIAVAVCVPVGVLGGGRAARRVVVVAVFALAEPIFVNIDHIFCGAGGAAAYGGEHGEYEYE